METHSEGWRWPRRAPKAQEADDDDGGVSLKEYGDPARRRVTNHIFWTQGLKSGDISTLPALTQVRVEFCPRLFSYQQAGGRTTCHHMQRRYGGRTRRLVPWHPIIHSSSNKAFIVRQRKHNFFQQNIRTRLASYVQMTGEREVCLCMQRQQYVLCIHTHTHARVDGRGADTHRWGGGCFSLSPGMAVSLRLPHSKKFELFLNFSSKFESNCENLLLLYQEEEEIRPASSPSSSHPFLSCPSSSSWGRTASSAPSSSSSGSARTLDP